jgi:hypothetical protein
VSSDTMAWPRTLPFGPKLTTKSAIGRAKAMLWVCFVYSTGNWFVKRTHNEDGGSIFWVLSARKLDFLAQRRTHQVTVETFFNNPLSGVDTGGRLILHGKRNIATFSRAARTSSSSKIPAFEYYGISLGESS